MATPRPAAATPIAAPALGLQAAHEATFVGGLKVGTHHGVGDLCRVAYDGVWRAAREDPAATELSGFLLRSQGASAVEQLR